MEHISQLLVRARKITANSNKAFIFGIVEYRPDLNKFTAGGTITSKNSETVKQFYSEHDSKEAALSACEAIAAQYPNAENVNFIIDDLTFEERDNAEN